MTEQQIIVLGQMWPNGHPEAISAAIDYIGETNPGRVIATAGATESLLRGLRKSYDGWIGVHVSKASLCHLYGAERLETTFEFAPGWVTYSGPLRGPNPNLSVMFAAMDMQQSVVSGSSANFQRCSYTRGLDGPDRTTWTGVGVGHLRSGEALPKHEVGFAHLLVTSAGVEPGFVRYEKGELRPPA